MSANPSRKVSSPITVDDLCKRLGTTVPEGVEGKLATGVTSLTAATAWDVSFLSGEKFIGEANNSRALLIIAPHGFELERKNVVYTNDVMGAVLTVIEYFFPAPAAEEFVHPTAVVADSAKLGANVFVGPHVTIGEGAVIGDNVRIEAGCAIGARSLIGEGSLLHPRAVVQHECVLGKRVILHPGAVIGADGFKYEFARGRLSKIPQVGRVVLGDDVEVGANATIDRAGFADTSIGARTKIDNLVHIAHNCTVGSDCVIVAQVGVAGSVTIGRGVMIGGQAAVKDHVTIGDGAMIGGRSGVSSDLAPQVRVIGNPTVSLRDYGRLTHFMKNFGSYWEKLRPLLRDRDSDDMQHDASDDVRS